MNDTEKHSSTYILKYAYECKEKYFVYIGNIGQNEDEQIDFLIKSGWKGIFFNHDEDIIDKLSDKYSKYESVKIVNRRVTPLNMVELLNFYSVPIRGFLLLLDIKSYDYFILKSLLSKVERYRPDIVVSVCNQIILKEIPLKFAAKFNEDFEIEDCFSRYSLSMIEYIMELFNYKLIDFVNDNVIVLRKCFENEVNIKDINKLLDDINRVYSSYSYDSLEQKYINSSNGDENYLWIPTTVQENSLVNYAENVFSQRGDDGIIKEIFRRLNVKAGTFIEFGAWDGIHLSNTKNLLNNGWKGIMIEANKKLARQLFMNYENEDNLITIYGEVIPDSFPVLEEREVKLKDLQKKYFDNIEIDFVSIDIDHNDVEIFELLDMDPMPALIALESGLYWNPRFTKKVDNEIASNYNVQQPLGATIEIAKSKGYIPICFNQNLYLILEKYHHFFSDIKNDTITLWYDAYNSDKVFSEKEKPYIKTVRKENSIISQTEGPGFEEI